MQFNVNYVKEKIQLFLDRELDNKQYANFYSFVTFFFLHGLYAVFIYEYKVLNIYLTSYNSLSLVFQSFWECQLRKKPHPQKYL